MVSVRPPSLPAPSFPHTTSSPCLSFSLPRSSLSPSSLPSFAVKKGGGDAAGFPSPRSSAHLPLAGCVGSGHWARAWWTSLYLTLPRSSDNHLSGAASSDHTRLHGTPTRTWISNVDSMSGVCHDIVQDAPAHYTVIHTCTRGEPTWISIVDSMSGVCQNVPAIVFHPSTVDPVRSLASGCFWLDYADDCGCGQSTADLA